MPRYFFHVRHANASIDRDGIELASNEQAKTLAVQTAVELLQGLDERFWAAPEWRMWITDESDATVCTLRFTAE